MVVELKDVVKLIGISVVCFCAVFVCTFMLNFYLDVQTVEGAVTDATRPLYDAQLAMAKFTCGISGGVLSVIAAIMLAFYIKLYIDANAKRIGVIKALGYSDGAIARRFWVFGISVLLGAAIGFGAGYAFMPIMYSNMTIEGLDVKIRFHAELLVFLVVIPTAVMSLVSCGYAYISVRRPVSELLRGTPEKIKANKKSGRKSDSARSFLFEMCLGTVAAKKSIAFFMAFACFCFSAMVQMGISMNDLSSEVMGAVILIIGVVLAIVTAVMAITTLVNRNIKNISVMKSFGYTIKECALAVFTGYVPFALIGFGLGTVYQYALLKIMMTLVYDGVQGMPEYSFDISAFFITLGLFVAAYALITAVYTFKMSKISVKEIMSEE